MAGGSCAKPGYLTSPYSDTLGQLALSQYMAGASLPAVRLKADLPGCSPGWLSWQVRPAVPARGDTAVTQTCFCPAAYSRLYTSQLQSRAVALLVSASLQLPRLRC